MMCVYPESMVVLPSRFRLVFSGVRRDASVGWISADAKKWLGWILATLG